MTLLGRPRLVEAVTQHGLQLHWPDGHQQTVQPQVVESLAELASLAEFELILVTVKSFDTAAAVASLAGRLSETAQILSLQNGVGNEETLVEIFPQQAVIAGSITLPVAVPETGTIIVSKEKGGIGLAVMSPEQDQRRFEQVVACLQRAEFRVAAYRDYRSLKWSKLLMNQIGNATSAILDLPPSQSLLHSVIFDVELAALRETLAVMRAQGIGVVALSNYPLPPLALALRWLPNVILRPALRKMMIGGRGDKLPSLQLDLRQGRPQSEVRVLNEAVAIAGERLGVPVPVNRGLSDLLNGIVAGEIDWDVYRGKVDLLGQILKRKIS